MWAGCAFFLCLLTIEQQYDISNNGRAILLVFLIRYFDYGFWAVLEVAIMVGLHRLVISPVTARLLDKERFGLFDDFYKLSVVYKINITRFTPLKRKVNNK